MKEQAYGGDYSPEDSYVYCPVCGAEMEPVNCWQCHGEGGWHDCGEDCCPCLDKEEIDERCDECDGKGWYHSCPSYPHTDEQMAGYWAANQPEQGEGEK